MNEQVLGHFLRYKREHANLADYSVNADTRRRTPGLTRDEVASMGHVSVDWYTRIEQGRTGATPSFEVLADLCRVLRFSQPETDYVFNLVGLVSPQSEEASISGAAWTLLQAHNPEPAFIMDQNLTVIATNHSFQRLYGNWDTLPPLQRNWVWRTFKSSAFRDRLSGWVQYAHYVTGVFRKVYSSDADSKILLQVYTAIKADPVFAAAWDDLVVSDFHVQHMLVNSQTVGELYLVENVLGLPGTHQYVVFEDAGDQSTGTKFKQLAGADE